MSQENQSYLRFSVEESLWFRKGQEVEELVSISLDPDITIQENEQYVTIRGSLELTGEYKNCQETDETESEVVASQKFVERVAEREEGVCEFSHRFPVDITIPNNRIQSVYDIDVLVDSFDYSIPERSCLKLSAELTISGLYEAEKQEVPEQEYEVLHRAGNEAEEVPIEQPSVQPVANDLLFEAEARKQQEEESQEVFPKFPNFNYQPQQQEPIQPYRNPWQFQPYSPEAMQSQWNQEQGRNEGNKPVEVELKVEEGMVVEKEPAEMVKVEVEVEVGETEESSSSSSSSEEILDKVKKKFIKKKSMTLTEFFARKDEGAAQAKLKVCIVQKGDTVETIADRFDVSVQNLLRANQLDYNQDVFEGQVLYIPAALAKK
ncbi:stage VI sporulation protein D [Neobacillus sp. LXY-1]|uniref:stage VI sporulation protein D n=1 Tax=Neobacillus sp. LXY-1 TaxID=3379133 RepID=UPI003EE259F7